MIQDRMIAAIVQARMGSTRLPGKVLRELAGKPMLWHIINRIEQSKYIKKIIIAATLDKRDDHIEKFVEDYGAPIYRGEVDDIVDRYFQAANNYDVDIIVRVWGDCPLIDPDIINMTIQKFLYHNADYANNSNPPSFPRGLNVEIYSIDTLKRILEETDDPFYREYPFEYIKAYGDSFRTVYLQNESDLSALHWTVDYLEDFKLVERIFEELYSEGAVFKMNAILELMEKHPELKEKNMGFQRNIEYHRDVEIRKTYSSH